MARAMKDSGIEWIGEIPANWECVPIRSLFQEVNRKNLQGLVTKALKFTYGEIVAKTGFEAEEDNYVANTIQNYTIVEPGTIMLNGLNLNFDFVTRRIGLVKEQGVITSAYLAFRPIDSQKMMPEYATYLLKSYDHCKAFHNMGGGVRKILNFSELKHQYVLNLRLDIQQSIVAFLDDKCAEIDVLMADVQVQIETLEQYKRSVITEAVTKGLNPNASMKDSGTAWIDTIPSHWFLIPAKYMFHNSDLRRIGDDVLLTSSQKYGIISQIDYMERENAKIVLANKGIEDWKHVEPYDFIISLRSFQGGLEMSEITGCITWHYVVLKASRTIAPKYYKWLFKSQSYITALQRTCNFIRDGQDLRFSNFSQVPLPEPPIEEQEAIAAYLDTKCAEIDAIIDGKRQQMATLEEYKKSIIFEYVTGKKEVPISCPQSAMK